MYKRVILENWHTIVPVLAFAFTSAFFISIVIVSVKMKRGKAEKLSRIPFDDDSESK